MAKQVIVGALEEVLGEYVLNIDTENLKIAALRGKIKLENIQLDGDLLGGHILGSIGLSGFGILSCWAKSLKITVPLHNLENEPTRIEITGCHLLCLPLIPSTANRLFGSGSEKDPKCTLRTRAKRAKLARYEKNYLSGRIPGEGQVTKRIQRAVREVERHSKKKSKRKSLQTKQDLSASKNLSDSTKTAAGELSSEYSNSAAEIDDTDDQPTDSQNLPELPKDWKVKLREKVLRNLIATFSDIHIRCEVSRGGLDFCHPDYFRQSSKAFERKKAKQQPKQDAPKQEVPKKSQTYDQRAFAFGVTLETFSIRTANEEWQVGSHAEQPETKEKDHLGPNPYDARNNKIFNWQDFCMYWDDEPPFMISETDIIRAANQKMSTEKFHGKISSAMESISQQQEPGKKVRDSLRVHERRRAERNLDYESRPHQYCWRNFSLCVRQKLSNRTEPGPLSCLAEFLPFDLGIAIRPHQFVQYQKLKSAMLSQQRFDTMVRQRPSKSPLQIPREWWKYAFGCITSRPNARPWNDVFRISKERERYIELVLKKLSSSSSGFHRGLSETESTDLLTIEDLLPLEALLSFHLVALREHTDSPNKGQWRYIKASGAETASRGGLIGGTFSRIFTRSRTSKAEKNEGENKDNPIPPSEAGESCSIEGGQAPLTILEAMVLRLGKKMWMTNIRIFQGRVTVTLLTAQDIEIARLVCEGVGKFRFMGQGNLDSFFDITEFEVEDCQTGQEGNGKILIMQPATEGEDDTEDDDSTNLSLNAVLPFNNDDAESISSFLDLPPPGVLCRFAASREKGRSTRVSVSAHPATLVWTTPCFKAVAEFFGAPSSLLQTELARNLRNAATPLARRAQLAFLSQSEFMLHVNVAAPKVWVPFSSSSMGALFLDAGNLRVSCVKQGNSADSDWSVVASDMQVNFAKWRFQEILDRLDSPLSLLTSGPYSSVHGVHSIIRPFQVHASCETLQDMSSRTLDGAQKVEGPGNCIEVVVSPICLNLVDAEVIARAIGKWYSQGLMRARGLSASRNLDESQLYATTRAKGRQGDAEMSKKASNYISFTIDKIEMALEGHSKTSHSDEKSICSQDTGFDDLSPSTRTYVVEIVSISAQRLQHHDITTMKGTVSDIMIMQLQDSTDYTPLTRRRDNAESQHIILERGNHERLTANLKAFENELGSFDSFTETDVLQVTFFHDRTIHLDEVEIDISSVVLRVTPTTLKDCTKGMKRVVELGQLVTREMERKVHESGRKARRRDVVADATPSQRPASPAFSMYSDSNDEEKGEMVQPKSSSDSSLLFKLKIRDGTILAGKPVRPKHSTKRRRGKSSQQLDQYAVVQVLTNALVMFQSIENPDASGTKTLHISLDNLSASVDTEFLRVPTSKATPMIGPTGAEFRIVNATENFGSIVSHDVAADCEHVKSSLTLQDLSILVDIVTTIQRRLHGVQGVDGNSTVPLHGSSQTSNRKSFISFLKYQKSGSGIATSIRLEVHDFSFIVLRDYQTKYGAPQFIVFKMKDAKTQLGGCISALSGEFGASLSVEFFNADVSDWEYTVEPFHLSVNVDQMPNELILDVTTVGNIQLNLTGILLRDLVEQDFVSLVKRRPRGVSRGALTPSRISTVGLRRATESQSVIIHNRSGIDLDVSVVEPKKTKKSGPTVRFDFIGPGIIKDSSYMTLDTLEDNSISQYSVDELARAASTICLRPVPSERNHVAAFQELKNLPLTSPLEHTISLHILRAVAGTSDSILTQNSPRSADVDKNASSNISYQTEPVVEWCMQNQRLRSSTVDLFSLEKGHDLLSSGIWSPEDEYSMEDWSSSRTTSYEARKSTSPSRKAAKSGPKKSNWIRPYLKNDSPEWTDMTCILRMARERVMLPDSSWIWLDDWKVDVSGSFGEETDADGWEYQADFETFTRSRRFYVRGDSCRRRRWTRTRIVRPPRLDDPGRQLRLVWETSRDKKGNFQVEVRSHVTIHNRTSAELSFFLFSPSWEDEQFLECPPSDSKVHVPIPLASAVYLRLARSRVSRKSSSLDDYDVSDRIMIVPTSYNSNAWIRSSMRLGDVTQTNLHFLLNIECKKGVIAIFIEPVVKILNLLPCHLECQFGEILRPDEKRPADPRPIVSDKNGKRRIAKVETINISSANEGVCTALNPSSKPHVSLRVPGYKWSAWQKVLNRKADTNTWRPPEAEEDLYLPLNRNDPDNVDEFKAIVHFDRWGTSGDPITVIMSVENGHYPTVRVYAQYWIIDKSGFGCRFCDSFVDLLGTMPDADCSRRSYLKDNDTRNQAISQDMKLQGHQWSIGMSGMSLYFSLRERLAMRIESTVGERQWTTNTIQSQWTSPMDISNVMPKTVFFVDELSGLRRFELAMSVTFCQGAYSRTRLVTLIPRYQIVNLLKRELAVSQDSSDDGERMISSQSSSPFHWEKKSHPSKVRFGAPTTEEKDLRNFYACWSNGCIQLDRIGITSLRLPSSRKLAKPIVVQVEVRLATKEQNSAVVIVVWSANEKSNPLYLLRNLTSHTILCRQPLQNEHHSNGMGLQGNGSPLKKGFDGSLPSSDTFQCGGELGPVINSFLGLDRKEEFLWVLRSGEKACFGFDDPEKPHILEWTCVEDHANDFEASKANAFVEVDSMGSWSILPLGGNKDISCKIGAEHSTKVIEFAESPRGGSQQSMVDSMQPLGTGTDVEADHEDIGFSIRLNVPALCVSVVDNANRTRHGREILAAQIDSLYASFSQSREGYHEMELRLMSLQVDNHVSSSIHPVLVFYPQVDKSEPFLHFSAVRRLQKHSATFVFRYAAFRMLDVNVFLDRRTAETIAQFIEPLTTKPAEMMMIDVSDFADDMTIEMAMLHAHLDKRAPGDFEMMSQSANSGRIYFEQLHLHPIRISLTFTQEWNEQGQGTESIMLFQFMRGMASIADAPLTFTSFVVGNVFESPHTLFRIISTHYSSQLTKQIFAILGSLAILGAPADFISNVGTGVRDFFYEPIQGAVHGPRQFIEGLEAGTQSLARGVFVGVVRGAANVTEVVNANLAGLTADDDFIDERKAHQRMLTDAMSRGVTSRTINDSLFLAGASVARGLRSGALGIVEQPTRYASKHGPVGFVKGVGKAMVGAIVKPVVGVGDAAALLMNHVSDATSNREVMPKIPKRLRRALPSRSTTKPNCVILKPYDDRAAKAQKIVTGGESVNDVYIGHVNIPSHLIIASDQCLWAIDRRSREPWCVSWEEISHFGLVKGGMRVVVFSRSGLKPFLFRIEDDEDNNEFYKLLSMQINRMGNAITLAEPAKVASASDLDLSLRDIPGIKSKQMKHVFGSCNQTKKRLAPNIKDEIDLIEQCFGRVKRMSSESTSFFEVLDDEAWALVSCWGQVFSGLSSRRCIAAGIINGTGSDVQIKSTKLMEGGSPCYSIPTSEFDADQGVLHPGGAIIFFGWGVVPSLLQPGNVFMHVETNVFIADLADQKSRATYAEALPSYRVNFLEKSYDDTGWWAKYWLLLR